MVLLPMVLASFLTVSDVAPVRAVHVVIETQLGKIDVDLDAVHAPKTTANFLRYVDGGFYSGGRFHRTVTMQNQAGKKVKIEVVQAGTNPKLAKKDFERIKLERTSVTGLKHLDGTISMARDKADSATSDFFICIGSQPELDFGGKRNADGQGFAAFGRVTRGMDVVKKIQTSPANGQTLTPPVQILSIRRAKSPGARAKSPGSRPATPGPRSSRP